MSDWALQLIRQAHRDGSTTVCLEWRCDGEPPAADCTELGCRLCGQTINA